MVWENQASQLGLHHLFVQSKTHHRILHGGPDVCVGSIPPSLLGWGFRAVTDWPSYDNTMDGHPHFTDNGT